MNETKATEVDARHKQVGTVVSSVALTAFGTFFVGAFFGAPWPGAIGCCALSAMGGIAAFVMLRRS